MAVLQSSRSVQLASIITSNTTQCDQWFVSQGIPQPSFDEDLTFTSAVPDEVTEAREKVIEASTELQSLMLGPAGYVQYQMREVCSIRWKTGGSRIDIPG